MKKPLSKLRLDQLLVERGYAPSRSRAQALIMAGKVFSGGQRLDKPGHQVAHDISIEMKEDEHPWVSRGGMKLAHGLEYFNIDVSGMVALDVGASTGGFTDVLLQRGAAKVYAVDVGYGQLEAKLRNDERVVVLEKTNARYLTREQIPDPVDIIVCDASFISLKTVLPAVLELAEKTNLHHDEKGFAARYLIALIKPQFEVGKGKVGKGGVVRDPELHDEVCEDIKDWLESRGGWQVIGITTSPITGPKGNKEFLIGAQKI